MKKVFTGVIIETNDQLTLTEFSQAIEQETDFIIMLIDEQLIIPAGASAEEWLFDSICLRRAKTAASFHQDLEVNVSGIALALDLLDKIDRLQTRVDTLEKLTNG